MKASAASTLALAVGLLCTVQASAQKDVTSVKPGECPRRISWCDGPPPYNHMCNNDADCQGTQKCCIQVCTQECRDAVPVEPKPGMCPADPIRCINPEDDLCKIDSDCTGDLKCCHFHCGLKCTNATAAAVEPKPGMCPADPIRCINPEDDLCKIDSDCTGDLKCCHFHCGLKCTNATAAAVKLKPGECQPDNIRCSAPEPAQCQSDSNCIGDLKCCHFHCGLKCRNATAVKPKPGQCPETDIVCIRGEDPLCHSDSDCLGDKKCCDFHCGLKCKLPTAVKAKPGECPPDNIRCSVPEPAQCQSDSTCTGDLKCCHFHCGLKCMNATADKAGQCPKDDRICKRKDPDQCNNDFNCTGNQKCCKFQCGLKCKEPEPAPEKSGLCPLPPSYPTCDSFPTPPRNECATDQECQDDQKCCQYGCSLQCKKPLQDKSGHCPSFNRSICLFARPAPAACSSDSQCEGTDRCCCHGNCRMECTRTVTVKPGTCPRPPADCGYRLPAQRCEDDGDCTGRKKCCAHCGVQCMDPAENPGFCPVDPGLEQQCGYRPPPRCTNDRDCQPDEKCCLFGCGVQCVKALPVKPGMCPAILAKCTATPDKPQCQHDGDCMANKKCCQMCGNKCLEAVPDRPGICPSYDPKPKICPAIYMPSCDHDWKCEENKKCCNTGCRRECVKPLKVKMGECPKITSYHKPQETCKKCNTDKDCPGKYRCCPGAHGLECRQPSGNPGPPHQKERPDAESE